VLRLFVDHVIFFAQSQAFRNDVQMPRCWACIVREVSRTIDAPAQIAKLIAWKQGIFFFQTLTSRFLGPVLGKDWAALA